MTFNQWLYILIIALLGIDSTVTLIWLRRSRRDMEELRELSEKATRALLESEPEGKR